MNESKSPRDWLLARHANAERQLDVLRRAALPVMSPGWRDVLRELFRPHRRAWQALAIVWTGVLAFHFTLGRPRSSAELNPPPPAAIDAWLKQMNSYDAIAQMDHRP
jgi:hypothetical protein